MEAELTKWYWFEIALLKILFYIKKPFEPKSKGLFYVEIFSDKLVFAGGTLIFVFLKILSFCNDKT